ncbi:MAG TPA: YkgJ family cysteine cluster protein [bacterium]|nr:YkgJ family cysteine cluster protein [bacterium]
MASKKQGCSCEKCRECCRREPGWFLPGEIAPAATFLNLTETEFVRKFCKEHIEGGIAALSPAVKPGTTECIFLKRDGLCGIHPVKPHECRKVMGCEGPNRHRRIREIIRKQWK